MRLTAATARAQLEAQDHGVLCTVHAERGVDAVPVVFAVHGDLLAIPVDTLKPKSTTRLQREENLLLDPRATLLVEHWDPLDWSRLWWARATLLSEGQTSPGEEAELGCELATKYVQYRDQPFVRVLPLRILSVTGWSAEPHEGGADDELP
ncbi:pyridoxamine 5'-phosphate oxidase family protein [Ornithinimicrobium cavernae]|uniref:pyridoxamine 5'-phosphate oxidase family protein n=1 Tax=Ornithinimicrobium cavernae TaxID=2666047 RepID=UPI000D68CB70|nr:pyridoxamine 5'-phosphate oxidase family protein [Ornithinimicrobium cavernae]